MLRFVISALVVTLLLAIITFSGSHMGWWILPAAWLEILLFVLFITLVVYYKLNKLKSSQPETFAQFYLLSIVVKMIGSLALIFFIVWENPESAAENVVLFIITYLMLTFLEVFLLFRRSAR